MHCISNQATSIFAFRGRVARLALALAAGMLVSQGAARADFVDGFESYPTNAESPGQESLNGDGGWVAQNSDVYPGDGDLAALAGTRSVDQYSTSRFAYHDLASVGGLGIRRVDYLGGWTYAAPE